MPPICLICLICPIGLIPTKKHKIYLTYLVLSKKICTFAAVIHTLCVIASIVLNVPAVLKVLMDLTDLTVFSDLSDLSDLRDLRALNDLKQTTIIIFSKKSFSLLFWRAG